MRMKRIAYTLALLVAAQFGAGVSNTKAGLILTFGQTSGSNTITGTKTSDTGFTISGADVAIQITQIDPSSGLTPPISAYLNMNLASTAAAGSVGGVAYYQAFSGSVQITSGTGGSGTNYLSTTTLSGLLLGIDATANATFGNTPGNVTLSSSVFSPLGAPMDLALQLGNLSPVLALQGNSLRSFTASINGNASAAIPEPSALVTAMIGLLVTTPILRRRFHRV